MARVFSWLAIFMLVVGGGLLAAPDASTMQIGWERSPELPEARAGAFAGVDSRTQIVAGGVSKTGELSDIVFVLELGADQWVQAGTIARPRADGVTVMVDTYGVIMVGGREQTGYTNAVESLRWSGDAVQVTSLPELPEPAAFQSGAALGGAVYIAGGRRFSNEPSVSGAVWRLDLDRPESERAWEFVPSWPGVPRVLAVAGVQDGALFIFGGETDVTGGIALRDAFRYSPTGGWSRVADSPFPMRARSAVAIGSTHLVVVDVVTESEETAVLAYETVTDTWRTTSTSRPARSAASVVKWRRGADSSVLVVGGSDRWGVPLASVDHLSIGAERAGFRTLDYAALIAYLLAMVAMGAYFARRGKTTDDFFLAGRRIPWWAATLSIFSTQLSAITFMAIPGKAYATDWVSILMNLGIILVSPLIVFWFLPFFRRLNITTAYEYLEKRFGLAVRLYGSLCFIVYQFGRMGIVMFLPALALATVTGFNVYACIAIMGILCTIYTVLGGIEAVVWTDVLQTFVLVGGAVLSLVIVVSRVDGGLSGIVSTGVEHQKFHVVNVSGGLASTAFWVVLIGGIFTNFIPFSTDQSVIQRYLTTPTEKAAARAIWTHAVMVAPSSILFFGLGTALFAFYKAKPELLNPAAASTDMIFPWFIANELPTGISGLVIAALFAATMSSIDSGMNSIATVLVTDFYRRFVPNAPDRTCLRLARWLTVLIGVVATLSAVLIGWLDAKSLFDLFLKNAGLLGSSLAGVFLLGVLTRRANSTGTMTGVVACITTLYVIQNMNPVPIHGYFTAVVGILVCVFVGYATSLAIPGPTKSVEGLTVATLGRLQSESSKR